MSDSPDFTNIASRRRLAFTLIELLVVIAIIALLISILLPALNHARKVGQAVKCAANLKDIGSAMAGYQTEWSGTYPPAYIYPTDPQGNYDFYAQDASHPFGYLHWSWFLYNRGTVDDKSFMCPGYYKGGAPRTNPGARGEWEEGQVDQGGGGPPGDVEDSQAKRLAYAGNAAIFPRNKFTEALSGGQRVNIFTSDSHIGDAGKTILVTEYADNWKVTATGEGGGLLSKAHRSINPFTHLSSGSDEYSAGPDTPGFSYGNGPYYGLLPKKSMQNATGMLDTPGIMETNAVGRHHIGATDSYIGGTANFLYADGHVEKKSVLETVKNWEWGTRYFSITGHNKIGPPY
ncbi:MAG TPA: prepilin-type N-terminal cleavage/methylation domain-containing protein [Phycisphaerae bacterium]|nr:prepilin-type N-terminal cleavage/methylation domain-containing protein [Phycisphaerae bacterium]